MSKLKGVTRMTTNAIPKEEKIGLMSESKYLTKTYRITLNAVEALDELTERLCQEARINIAKSKVLELIIFNAFDKSLEELLK